MTRELAIIADDLSSAADCGIQVARSGLRTFVPLSWEALRSADETVEVASVDAGIRSLSAGKAYDRVKTAVDILVTAGYPSIYKSVDSTLRGNLGAEIDAVLDVFDADLVVVAPALPLYGRTTVGGRHYLRGELIHGTEFGTDPQCPLPGVRSPQAVDRAVQAQGGPGAARYPPGWGSQGPGAAHQPDRTEGGAGRL